jgi:hypothetical protein
LAFEWEATTKTVADRESQQQRNPVGYEKCLRDAHDKVFQLLVPSSLADDGLDVIEALDGEAGRSEHFASCLGRSAGGSEARPFILIPDLLEEGDQVNLWSNLDVSGLNTPLERVSGPLLTSDGVSRTGLSCVSGTMQLRPAEGGYMLWDRDNERNGQPPEARMKAFKSLASRSGILYAKYETVSLLRCLYHDGEDGPLSISTPLGDREIHIGLEEELME